MPREGEREGGGRGLIEREIERETEVGGGERERERESLAERGGVSML
jgi:hypothetical protein